MPVITIHGYSFTLPMRYANPDHAPTRGELDALEALRAENIRNNVSKWVTDAEQAAGGLLDAQAQSALQERISEYESRYEFTPRQQVRQLSAFEVELRECAEERIEAEYGLVPGMAGFEERLKVLLASGALDQEARRRALARRAVAAAAIDDLFT